MPQHETSTEKYIKLPNTDINLCFGCGPDNKSGLQMEFYAHSGTVYSDLSVPEHLCGWSTIVHGGVVTTILDEIMSWSAVYLLKKVILTKSIKVNFLKPVMIGDRLKAVGKIHARISEREAEMSGELINSKGEICASSNGIFALFTIDFVREKGIFDASVLTIIEHMMNAT